MKNCHVRHSVGIFQLAEFIVNQKKRERPTKSSWPSVTFKDKKGPVKKQRLSELTHAVEAVEVASEESEKTLLAAKMRSKSKKY